MDMKLGRYIVNGAHEAPKLQDILDGFIKKFVLCPGCDNPETDLVSGEGMSLVISVVSIYIYIYIFFCWFLYVLTVTIHTHDAVMGNRSKRKGDDPAN